MSSAARAWLIDASIYIFRAWFSMPDNWHTADGMPVGAVYGYTRFLLDFIEQTDAPQHCAAAFDESLGSNYRNAIYPAYKSSRELPDETLAFQLEACREVTERLGIPCYGGPLYEADDYLATLARLFREADCAVTVVTRDKDLGQLIHNPDDNWWDFAQGELIDRASFSLRFGVAPEQFADYLALVGDPVDDIPGVPGIGAKTAAALLQLYPTLDKLGRGLHGVHAIKLRGARGIAAKLKEHWPQVLLARQLASLEDEIDHVQELPRFDSQPENFLNLAAYLKELNIEGPLQRRCEQLAKQSR
ncbi:MAG: 5'-3' exonuclease H3TH domain-containing protein [Halioglobus sp.]